VLVDCQVQTEHLARFGAEDWPRERFLEALRGALAAPTRRGSWACADEACADEPRPDEARPDEARRREEPDREADGGGAAGAGFPRTLSRGTSG
jgi:hypothetical protein